MSPKDIEKINLSVASSSTEEVDDPTKDDTAIDSKLPFLETPDVKHASNRRIASR